MHDLMVNLKAPGRPLLSSSGFRKLGAALLGPVAAFSLAGCITPESDYNDYLSRTAPFRGPPAQPDSGPVDASAPDGGFQGNYFVACLPQLASGNTKDDLTFVGNVSYASNALSISMAPLVAGATDLSQLAQGGQQPLVAQNAPVSTGATFIANFGAPPPELVGSANPITPGSPIVFKDVELNGVLLSQSHFCGTLCGCITSPIPVPLGPGNTCVFDEIAATTGPIDCEDAGAVCDKSDFTCPGTPACPQEKCP
jgi:hypothetical protein